MSEAGGVTGGARPSVLAGAVAAIAAGVFGPSLAGGWIYDDNPLIADNLYVHSLRWWSRWFTHDFWDVNEELKLLENRMVYWRPSVTASYALDWQLGQGSPVVFHVSNLVWHAVASLLAFSVLRRWVGATIPALLGALLFAIHPTKAESVAWIAGRTDVLCAVAMLLATEGCKRRLRAERGGIWLELGATALAYTIKEQAITMPAFIAVEIWVALGRPPLTRDVLRRMAVGSLPQLAAAVAYWAIRSAFFPVVPWDTTSLPLAKHVARVFETMGRYVSLTFVPHDLSIQQGLVHTREGVMVDSGYAALGAAALVALVAIAIAARRRWPGVSLGIGFYWLTLLPTSNMIDTHMATLLSERFLYLPELGLCLAAGAAMAALFDAKRPIVTRFAVTASVGAILALAAIAAKRSADFVDEVAFWDREQALHPESIEAIRQKINYALDKRDFALGTALAALGQRTAAKYLQPKRYQLEFILSGLECQLLLTPDHDTPRLLAIERFLPPSLIPMRLQQTSRRTRSHPVALRSSATTLGRSSTRENFGVARGSRESTRRRPSGTRTSKPRHRDLPRVQQHRAYVDVGHESGWQLRARPGDHEYARQLDERKCRSRATQSCRPRRDRAPRGPRRPRSDGQVTNASDRAGEPRCLGSSLRCSRPVPRCHSAGSRVCAGVCRARMARGRIHRGKRGARGEPPGRSTRAHDRSMVAQNGMGQRERAFTSLSGCAGAQ